MRIKIEGHDNFEVKPEGKIEVEKNGMVLAIPAGVMWEILRDIWTGGSAARAEFNRHRDEIEVWPGNDAKF